MNPGSCNPDITYVGLIITKPDVLLRITGTRILINIIKHLCHSREHDNCITADRVPARSIYKPAYKQEVIIRGPGDSLGAESSPPSTLV